MNFSWATILELRMNPHRPNLIIGLCYGLLALFSFQFYFFVNAVCCKIPAAVTITLQLACGR